MTVKTPQTNVFPGGKGLELLVSDELLILVGNVSKCLYHFRPGKPIFVDKRDMPKLPKDKLRKADPYAPSSTQAG